MSQTTYLAAGKRLAVTAGSGSTGVVRRLADTPGGGGIQSSTSMSAGTTTYFGPYAGVTRWEIVTSTGADLTYAFPSDTAMTVEADQTISGVKTNSTAPLTSVGVGAANGATVSAVEQGNGVIHKTVLTLTATPITLTDEAGAGQYGGVKVYDMPAGNHLFLGAVIDADITLVGTEWLDTAEGDVGLGTTAVTNADALATTEQNIIATTEIAALVAQVGPINAGSADVATVAAAGGTDSDIYLNVRIDDNAAHITASATVTGTITFTWVNLGDY